MLGKLFGKIRSQTKVTSPEPVSTHAGTPDEDLGFPSGQLPEANVLWGILEKAKPKYMLELLQAITDRRIKVSTYGQFTAITRRLLEIRYHENISKDLREVFETLSNQYLEILGTNEDAESAKNIQAAIDHTISVGKLVGYGTVGHALTHHADDPAATKFAVQPGQAKQLGDFLGFYGGPVS